MVKRRPSSLALGGEGRAGFREALAEYCDAEPIPYTEFAGRK